MTSPAKKPAKSAPPVKLRITATALATTVGGWAALASGDADSAALQAGFAQAPQVASIAPRGERLPTAPSSRLGDGPATPRAAGPQAVAPSNPSGTTSPQATAPRPLRPVARTRSSR
jgi:hypothetical protein